MTNKVQRRIRRLGKLWQRQEKRNELWCNGIVKRSHHWFNACSFIRLIQKVIGNEKKAESWLIIETWDLTGMNSFTVYFLKRVQKLLAIRWIGFISWLICFSFSVGICIFFFRSLIEYAFLSPSLLHFNHPPSLLILKVSRKVSHWSFECSSAPCVLSIRRPRGNHLLHVHFFALRTLAFQSTLDFIPVTCIKSRVYPYCLLQILLCNIEW